MSYSLINSENFHFSAFITFAGSLCMGATGGTKGRMGASNALFMKKFLACPLRLKMSTYCCSKALRFCQKMVFEILSKTKVVEYRYGRIRIFREMLCD